MGLEKILLEDKPKKTGKPQKTNTNTGENSGGTQLPSTPFQTQAEGDAFRAWVRQTDAAYATQINLSATGPINNNFIRTAYQNYGNLYQQSLTSGGGTIQPPPAQDVDKAKEIFDKFNDSVFFYSVNNEIIPIEYTPQIGKWIKYFTTEDFVEESSYVGAILSLYGTNITKYKTNKKIQDKIDTELPNLQSYLKTLFEGIQLKKHSGLAQILEQSSNLVIVNVVNRIPKKQTEYDEYKDKSGIDINSIIAGVTELGKGDKSDTVVRVKEALGYTKDGTPPEEYSPYFTQDFDTFIIKYKGTNKLDNFNGNINQKLMCSIEQYKQLCSTSSGQKTTAPPTNTTDSTPIELKYLNDYVKYVGTGIPAYGPCKSLFDYYSQQALNYTRLKKVKKKPLPTDTEEIAKEKLEKDKLMELLKPIKDKIKYCQKSSDLKDRAKLDTLISQRFRIQQDKDSPYYLDI